MPPSPRLSPPDYCEPTRPYRLSSRRRRRQVRVAASAGRRCCCRAPNSDLVASRPNGEPIPIELSGALFDRRRAPIGADGAALAVAPPSQHANEPPARSAPPRARCKCTGRIKSAFARRAIFRPLASEASQLNLNCIASRAAAATGSSAPALLVLFAPRTGPSRRRRRTGRPGARRPPQWK